MQAMGLDASHTMRPIALPGGLPNLIPGARRRTQQVHTTGVVNLGLMCRRPAPVQKKVWWASATPTRHVSTYQVRAATSASGMRVQRSVRLPLAADASTGRPEIARRIRIRNTIQRMAKQRRTRRVRSLKPERCGPPDGEEDLLHRFAVACRRTRHGEDNQHHRGSLQRAGDVLQWARAPQLPQHPFAAGRLLQILLLDPLLLLLLTPMQVGGGRPPPALFLRQRALTQRGDE